MSLDIELRRADRAPSRFFPTRWTSLLAVDAPGTGSQIPRTRRPLSFLSFTLPLLLVDAAGSVAVAAATSGVGLGVLTQVALVVICLAVSGGYRPRFSLSVLNDLPLLLGVVAASAGAEALLSFLWNGAGQQLSAVLATTWPIALVVIVGRAVGYAVLRACRRRGLFATRTVVVGAGQVGARLVRWARQYPEYGMQPIGFVDTEPPAADLGAPYLGEPGHLPAIAANHGVDQVVVAFGLVRATELVSVFRTADRMHLDVHLVPRFFEMQGRPASRLDRVFGMPLVPLRSRSRRAFARVAKRSLDIAASASALAALAPLLAFIALTVRLDGGPGVIFRQERVGRDGRSFTVYKFRSLRPANETESQTTWSIADDRRMSLLGKVLRKTSLDELPQLVNILRGDMSLVGPRPERPHFVDVFKTQHDGYEARHRVVTGLTGLAAVHGLRGDTSIEDRVYFDNQYIDSWSPWLDIVVIVRTVAAVLRGSHG